MKIAVTYDNGEIFQHFGKTENFKLYEIEEGTITNEEIIDTNGSGHGALAGFLKNADVDMLICGGIGGGAQAAISECGIKLYAGNSGSADNAVKKYLSGELEPLSSATCNHHEHQHEHNCGNGSCHR